MCAMSPRLLRPIAGGIHPEAAAWRSAVIANGGSVSGSTLNAVSKFCRSIDAAGIRDRFYRLNLFAGTGLNAALVPLYRSTSYGGSALGNATDTNNAFVGVGTDYAETGASGGLTGNGSTKYLDTGLTYDAMGVPATMHIAGFKGSGTWSTTTEFMGTRDADDFYVIQFRFPSSQLRVSTFAGGSSSIINEVAVSSDTSFVVLSRSSSTSHVLYENAVSIGSNAAATTPGGCNRNFLVFTRDDGSGAAASRWPHRISGYSIGLGLDATQVSSYDAAMQAFQAALGRNV